MIVVTKKEKTAKKDWWDKTMVIATVLMMFGTLYGAYYTGFIATKTIPNATATIQKALESCPHPYPIWGKVKYKNAPVIAKIVLLNVDLNKEQQIETNDLGEYQAETANWGWPGGSLVRINACYDTICQTKEITMRCSKGYDEVSFDL